MYLFRYLGMRMCWTDLCKELCFFLKIIQAANQSCVESVIAAYSVKEKDHGHVNCDNGLYHFIFGHIC